MVNHIKEGAGTNPRVLVVDDDPDTLVFLGKLLSQIPVDAVPTASCATARYAMTTIGQFDIVIADKVLPDGDGAALAAEFQRDHGCRTVIISGHDEPHDGLPEGVDLWVCKPVDLKRLKKAVVALMGA
jgi:two-component system, OmpR family, response regulator